MDKLATLYVLVAVIFSACIGEDIVEAEARTASLEITTNVTSLRVGDSLQLEFLYQDFSGLELTPNQVEWISKDPEIAMITTNGMLIANKLGLATIKLTVDDLWMDSISVEGAEMTKIAAIRRGSFKGSNGYSVTGSCELVENEGALALHFKEDFRSSTGPGLYVYMSNSESGISGGISLGKLEKSAGAQSYPVPEGTALTSFEFILIYCQPFGVPFGNAQLNE